MIDNDDDDDDDDYIFQEQYGVIRDRSISAGDFLRAPCRSTHLFAVRDFHAFLVFQNASVLHLRSPLTVRDSAPYATISQITDCMSHAFSRLPIFRIKDPVRPYIRALRAAISSSPKLNRAPSVVFERAYCRIETLCGWSLVQDCHRLIQYFRLFLINFHSVV